MPEWVHESSWQCLVRPAVCLDYQFALYSTPISWYLGSAITTR